MKLTSFSPSSAIYDLMPSADGSLVAFGQSTNGTDKGQRMFVVEAGATPVVHQLTGTGTFVTDMKCFSPDGQQVVYGVGTDHTAVDLRAQPISGGAVTTLKSALGHHSPMGCW